MIDKNQLKNGKNQFVNTCERIVKNGLCLPSSFTCNDCPFENNSQYCKDIYNGINIEPAKEYLEYAKELEKLEPKMKEYKCPKRDCIYNHNDICGEIFSKHWCNNIIIKDKNVDKNWISNFLYLTFKSQVVLNEFSHMNKEDAEKKAIQYVCENADFYYGYKSFDMD
jgi:hypothetical protein